MVRKKKAVGIVGVQVRRNKGFVRIFILKMMCAMKEKTRRVY